MNVHHFWLFSMFKQLADLLSVNAVQSAGTLWEIQHLKLFYVFYFNKLLTRVLSAMN